MRKSILLISLILSVNFAQALFAGGVNVRVAIIQDSESVRATVKGPYKIVALNTNLVLFDSDESLNYVIVAPKIYGIDIGSKVFKLYGVKIIPKKTDEVYINGIPYKGSATFIRKENMKLLVVNNLDLEDYLKGVLYHEVSHLWPVEALKAQAVAARTFALYQIESRKGYEFDVTSDIYSQVYGGSYSERERPNTAVKRTEGQILTYRNKVLPAYYHAVCGGHTEDASALWKTKMKPLNGVACDYCKVAPHYFWQAKFNPGELKNKLNSAGFILKDILKIQVLRFTKSGRVKDLKIISSDGSFIIISAKDLRQALGPNVIRSTNFLATVEPSGTILLEGKGWGHGVGMCQWGAFYMAARGQSYEQILQYYYPGAKIKNIK